jgi:hypothetical protein
VDGYVKEKREERRDDKPAAKARHGTDAAGGKSHKNQFQVNEPGKVHSYGGRESSAHFDGPAFRGRKCARQGK